MNRNDIIITRTEKDAPSPNTFQAAEKRRATINEQIDEFFAKGGKLTKLPAYDDLGPTDIVKKAYGRNYGEL